MICFLTPSGVVGLQIFGQLNILFSGASKDFSTSGTEILFIQVCFEQIQIKWKQMVLNDTHKECRKKKTTSKATNKNILYQKELFKTVDTDKYKKMKIFPWGYAIMIFAIGLSGIYRPKRWSARWMVHGGPWIPFLSSNLKSHLMQQQFETFIRSKSPRCLSTYS